LAELNRRLAARPDDLEALLHRGRLFTLQCKWSEAITDFEQFLRLRPDDSEGLWIVGDAYERTGQLTRALAAFDRLVGLAPEDHEARFERGLLALALAQPGQAAEDLGRVLTALPEWDSVRCRRAQALFQLGRNGEALAELDFLIPRNLQDPALYDLRGKVRDAIGDHEQAHADQEKASSLLTSIPKLLNDDAWIAATGPIAERDPERAVALSRRAVALASGVRDYVNTLGVALYRTGEYAEAISVLDGSRAAGKGELDAFDLFFLAMAHHQLGHRQEGRSDYDQAVRWVGAQKALPDVYTNELAAFQVEAERTLAHSADDLPEDVFANPR
jgi:tetratricopeptide (TPR) repeat protein